MQYVKHLMPRLHDTNLNYFHPLLVSVFAVLYFQRHAAKWLPTFTKSYVTCSLDYCYWKEMISIDKCKHLKWGANVSANGRNSKHLKVNLVRLKVCTHTHKYLCVFWTKSLKRGWTFLLTKDLFCFVFFLWTAVPRQRQRWNSFVWF